MSMYLHVKCRWRRAGFIPNGEPRDIIRETVVSCNPGDDHSRLAVKALDTIASQDKLPNNGEIIAAKILYTDDPISPYEALQVNLNINAAVIEQVTSLVTSLASLSPTNDTIVYDQMVAKVGELLGAINKIDMNDTVMEDAIDVIAGQNQVPDPDMRPPANTEVVVLSSNVQGQQAVYGDDQYDDEDYEDE